METGSVKNLVIVGQNASGKTSLAEAMLFASKATSRLGKVDDGTSSLDFEPEEIKRRITIGNSAHHLYWNKTALFFLDTPGDDNFHTETRIALRCGDTALFVIDAVDPVKPQTGKIWSMVRENGLPALFVVNKMDRERADFMKAAEAVKKDLGVKTVPILIPIGSQETFSGLVDLIRMKAFVYEKDGSGRFRQEDIPQDMLEMASGLRNNLIEYAAESEDALLEKFLEGEELTEDEIISGLGKGMAAGGFAPVVCASALQCIGLPNLLDLISSLLPSPDARGEVPGTDPKTGMPINRATTSDAPASAIVFKTTIDPYAGRLSLLRVVSGVISQDQTLFSTAGNTLEKAGQIFRVEGKGLSPTDSAGPGEIIAIPKLKETSTGDTLSDPSAPIAYPFVQIPKPVLSYVLKPKSRGDEEKISIALARLMEEDLAISVDRDPEAGGIILSGMGQIHIETTVEKMERKFGVHVDLELPRIPYRETIKGVKKGVIYRHKKQTGGAGQFAEVHFDISPLPRGQGFEFEEALVGMNVPRNFVPAVEKGLHEAILSGPLAGYPVVDVKVRFYDGKSHEVDSSETAFKIAAIQCFKKGVLEAKPTLLEPIMKLTIQVPDDAVGDVIGDLNSRRGRVMGMEPGEGHQVITAHVPLAEIQRYLIDLNTMTAGRGTYTVEPSHYEEMPANLAEKVIAAAAEDKAKA
ncbi:MAG: elongation factor G [Deltaproteobacteria bacterium]